MGPLDGYIRDQADRHLDEIGNLLNADAMSIISPILPGLEFRVRDALDKLNPKRSSIAIIHDTAGGVVEIVERMVNAIRKHYEEVIFVIPDRAMSAGTIFALSGDRILMNYFSCLGPIDPQFEREGRLVPALSYLNQFERLNAKASGGQLTTAEYALLSKLDLGELYQFEQARALSRELLVNWLTAYKFSRWTKTRGRGVDVTAEMRMHRAKEIAEILSDAERWHSHGRGINMATLTGEIGLEIEDFSATPGLSPVLSEYFELLRDYMARQQMFTFVHAKGYF